MIPTEIPSDAPLVLIDDCRGTFGPLTDLRAVFELRAGLGTIAERIEAAVGRKATAVAVDRAVAGIVTERGCQTSLPANLQEALVVHGRLLTASAARVPRGEIHATADGTFVAGWLSREVLAKVWDDPSVLRNLPATRTVEARFAATPWDLTTSIAATLEEDLAIFKPATLRALRPDEGQSFGTHPIAIDQSASIGPFAVIDAITLLATNGLNELIDSVTSAALSVVLFCTLNNPILN